jgi:hypothetical protein
MRQPTRRHAGHILNNIAPRFAGGFLRGIARHSVGISPKGWRRIGLAASIVWASGGAYWGYGLGARWSESASEDAVSRLYQCLNDENRGAGSELCEQREREIDRVRSYRWSGAALVGLGPVAVAWGAAYLAAAALRRRKKPPSG